MTDERLFDAFDDCLTRLKAGEAVADCLRTYPDLAADLGPMLEAARAAITVSEVPRPAQMRSRAQFLTAAGEMKPRPAAAGWWRSLSTVMALAVTAFIVWLGFSVVTNTVLTASTSTPTLTMTASPTHTAVNTATVEPSSTPPAPTETPSPTASATPVAPTLTQTASPTPELPTATSTSQPTQLIAPTVEPTSGPNATDDHGGSGTAQPTDDHSGSGTAQPTDDHGGSGTAQPTDDHGGDNSGSGGGGDGSGGSGGGGGDD